MRTWARAWILIYAGLLCVQSTAVAVEAKKIEPQPADGLHLKGVLSDICVIYSETEDKTYTLRQGDRLPVGRGYRVLSVAPGNIQLVSSNNQKIALTYLGRGPEDENREHAEEIDEEALEYYRRILEEQRQRYNEQWLKNRDESYQPEVVICNSDDKDCTLLIQGTKEEP